MTAVGVNSGVPLEGEGRWPWAAVIVARVASQTASLTTDRVVLASRAVARDDSFVPSALLQSQLSAFDPRESGERGVVIDVELPLTEVVDHAAGRIARNA